MSEQQLLETFSLSTNRKAVLDTLVPSSESYLRYNLLNYLGVPFDLGTLKEKSSEIESLLEQYHKLPGHNKNEYEKLRSRYIFMSAAYDPKSVSEAFKFVSTKESQSFSLSSDQVADDDSAGSFPSVYNPKDIDPLNDESIAFDSYTPLAWQHISKRKLDGKQVNHFLSLINEPDYDNLVDLIVQDFKVNNSQFGSHHIHKLLTVKQVNDLLKAHPDVIHSTQFVDYYLNQLLSEVEYRNIVHNPEAREKYLQKIWSFIKTLGASFDHMKVTVLYHILVSELERGIYDEEKFMEYIKIPKNSQYINSKWEAERVNTDTRVGELEGPGSSGDANLTLTFLNHVFLDEKKNDISPYSQYLDSDFLKKLLATTKLTNEPKDSSAWFEMVGGKNAVENLNNKVTLEFASFSKLYYGPFDPVEVEVNIKNVKNLIVKVFEINTFSYYKKLGTEIDHNLNLDGLIANYEHIHSFQDIPPMKKFTKKFSFPYLNGDENKPKRGVYIIEFIGNGSRIRTCIFKGRLQLHRSINNNGVSLNVIDERFNVVKDAKILIQGREFTSDKDGNILIPYSEESHNTDSIIISHDNFSSLASCYFPQNENHSLNVGFYVDRESLIKLETSKVLVRAEHRVNDVLVPLSNLYEVNFTIISFDKDNVQSQTVVQDFALYEDKESEYKFFVPENTRQLKFELNAKVKKSSNGEEITLSSSREFNINGIDGDADITEDLHLTSSEDGYRVYILGKTGEAKPKTVVHFDLKSKYLYIKQMNFLQTDEKGCIKFGKLDDITELEAVGIPAKLPKKIWYLKNFEFTYPSTINSKQETIALPYYEKELTRVQVSLFKVTETNLFLEDCFENIKLQNNTLELRDLKQGRYVLRLKERDIKIDINIIPSNNISNTTGVSNNKSYKFGNNKFVGLKEIKVEGNDLIIRLNNTTSNTRVHIFNVAIWPEFNLGDFSACPSHLNIEELNNSYLKVYYGGMIHLTSEHNYILNRKYAQKYIGNLLPKPSLLLNPREIVLRETRAGGAYARAYNNLEDSYRNERARDASRQMAMCKNAINNESFLQSCGLLKKAKEVKEYTSNLDFLEHTSKSFTNLKPDNGEVKIPKDQLHGTLLQVVIVDLEQTLLLNHRLPTNEFNVRDLRLNKQVLDPKIHYTEQRQITIVQSGQKFTIDDLSTAKVQTYGTLSEVYRLLVGLYGNSSTPFDFVLHWHEFNEQDKLSKFSKYCSHELNFFLFKKDKPFFDQVVSPYIQSKKDKQFMDYWLLNDLEALKKYVVLQEFNNLNIVEKILLGNKLSQHSDSIQKNVQGQINALDDDLQYFNYLFNSSIKGRGLDVSEGGSSQSRHQQINETSFQKRLYTPLGKTKEYGETGYYNTPIELVNSKLLPLNKFWQDVAQKYCSSDDKAPLVSKWFPYAHNNIQSIMFAISFLDLPFNKANHEPKYESGKMELVPKTPVIVFHQEIRDTKVATGTVLVSQNYFDPGDPTTVDESGEEIDKYISEFLPYRPYACQTILTNVSQSKQKLEVLRQIPAGSMPLFNGFFTQGQFVELEPNSTTHLYYYFYFPKTGDYQHYPIQVAKNEKVICYAPSTTLKVVNKPSVVDTRSWEYLSQRAPANDLLKFLENGDLLNPKIDFDRMAWRMHDKQFFINATNILRQKLIFNEKLWGYSVYHQDINTALEYLKNRNVITQFFEPIFQSPLLEIKEGDKFEYTEFSPLVQERAHYFESKGEHIENDNFRETYKSFLRLLSYKKILSPVDMLVATEYLILQDRIEEAQEMFKKINRDSLKLDLQYDYTDAYLDFFNESPKKAEEIAKKYTNYPVESWRKRFEIILHHLKEATGGEIILDESDRAQMMAYMSKSEPNFNFKIEGTTISIYHHNLPSCTVSFFQTDLELLFSTNAFSLQQLDQFSFVKPNKVIDVEFKDAEGTQKLEIPQELHNANMVISIQGAGRQESSEYYSHSLKVQVLENIGQLKVTDVKTSKPLTKVYIKVYSKTQSGDVAFYKDGYSDIRGRFDYVTKSNSDLSNIKKFSILVLSENNGAVIKEVNPPAS